MIAIEVALFIDDDSWRNTNILDIFTNRIDAF